MIRQMPIRLGTLLTLIALLTAACGSLKNPTLSPTPSPTPSPTQASAAAPGTPGLPPLPTGNDLKIDSTLLDVGEAYKQGGQPAAEQQARQTGLLNGKNELRVTLVLTDTNTQPVVDKVKAMGGRVPNTFENQIDVVVPLDTVLKYLGGSNQTFLQDLASFSNVREVQVTPKPAVEGLGLPDDATLAELQAAIGAAIVEGVAVSGADKWHAAGITGKGVKVGIIDGGFKGYKELLGKELPQNVTIKAFTEDGSLDGGVHGTGVAEIVHAMAPDAELILCAIDSQASFGNAIKYLTDEVKVPIIQHSMGWHTVRKDGNHFLAQQADYARGKGVLYVKSAGNEGDGHYTATFSPDQNGRHQFAQGKDRIAVISTGSVYLHLTWEAWTGDPVNYDLALYDERGTKVASSRNVQGAQKPPYEGVFFEAPQGQKFYAAVEAVGQQKAVRFDLVGKNTPIADKIPGVTPSGSISAPGDAKGAFTIGAINYKDDKLEDYSSQGPTLDGRRKPDLSAPTRVTTQAYGPGGFAGTSASTPHVSGAAALVLAAQPGATADQLQQFLQQNAKDLEEAGPESKTGFGRLAMGPAENARKPATTATGSAAPSATTIPRPSTPASAPPSTPAAPSASARPSAAPSAAASGQLRPLGTIPLGWQSFTHSKLSFAIAYPPDWVATDRELFGLFNPINATTSYHYLQILSDGRTTSTDQAQLREDGWKRIGGNICGANTTVISRYEPILGNVPFLALDATCTRYNLELSIFVAAAIVNGTRWEVSIILPGDIADNEIARALNPMLATLNIGGGTAVSSTPATSARPSPTAIRPAASPSPAALRPNAPIPASWRSYSGTTTPFAIAYPPDWVPSRGTRSVAFGHPNGLTGLQVGTRGEASGGKTLEQLRDDYAFELTNECREFRSQGTGTATYSGVQFADLGVSCMDTAGEVSIFYIAVGVQGRTIWAILAWDLIENFGDSVDNFFDPMLATLNLAAPQASAPTLTPVPQVGPVLTVTPSEVKSGNTVAFQGTQFEPGVNYGILITNENGQSTGYLAVDADANGEFVGTIQVGAPGVRLVKVLFGGGDIVATARFTITP